MSKVLNYFGAEADVTVGLDLDQKIESKIIVQEDGCWIYNGYYTQHKSPKAGDDFILQASIPYKGFWVNVRRYLIEKVNRTPLDREIRIKLTCDEARCINPDHAGYYTADEQVMLFYPQERKTTCDKGHDLTGEHGMARSDGKSLRCKTCSKEYNRQRYLANREYHIARQRAYNEAKRAERKAMASVA